MVHGWHDNDLLVGLEEHVDGKAYALDYAGYEREPLAPNVPPVMREQPVVYGGKIVFGRDRIAEDGVFEALTHGIGDGRAHGKVHVGHPHGVQVVTSPSRFESLVHEVAGAATVYDGGEIVMHNGDFNSKWKPIICIYGVRNGEVKSEQ